MFGKEFGLQFALAKLDFRVGVVHNPAAHTHLTVVTAQNQRPDWDVEHGFGIGAEESDRTAIDATGSRLQFMDPLHGTDLGRAGDRAAGEEGAEDPLRANPLPQFARHA